MDSTRNVPLDALRFDAAPIALAASEADAPRRFDGVAYSGEVIANHYFWGNVVFDLASTRAAERVPILIEHDRSQRAGVGQRQPRCVRQAGTQARHRAQLSGARLRDKHPCTALLPDPRRLRPGPVFP